MVHENSKSYFSCFRQDVDKMLAGFSHTLGLLMSKLRSSLEAGKKQLRVWLEYACSVTEVLLYPSFGAPIVFLMCFFRDSADAHFIQSCCTNITRWYAGGLTLVFCRCDGHLAEVYALSKIFVKASDVGFVSSRIYVYGVIILCTFTGLLIVLCCISAQFP